MIENDMSTQHFLVYKHSSPSGKSYVGVTSNLTKRNSKHRRDNGCIAFHTAIKKYGWESFTHEILVENLSLEEANDWEKFFIKIENTLAPNGYNLKDGGDSFTHSAETRTKISNSLKGKKASIEARAKISAAHKGKVNSPETRAKMSVSQKGKKRSAEAVTNISNSQKGKPSPKKGKPLSDEQKAKLIAISTGRKMSEESRAKMSEAQKKRFAKNKINQFL